MFPLRPELICREVSRQWKVALSADDECNIDKVFLNGKSLTPVDSEYNLSSFHGDLSIRYANREPEGVPLFNDTPLIFKLRNKWKGDGRKVAGITSGHFIVIVPKEWKRTGRAPVESADCTDPDFVAHYFFAKKGESAGDTGGFEGYDLALTASGFEMSGHRVFDDSDEGELFVDAPPKLCPSSGIVWVRIGKEGGGDWKGVNFKPQERSLEDVLNGRQGRFFIRVYDGEAKLMDSGEFRFLRDLREIRVNNEIYTENTLLVPRHSETKLQLLDAKGDTVRPKLKAEEACPTLHPDGTVLAKPHPEGDFIACKLIADEGSVDIVVHLPRIWWRLEEANGEPDEWCDKPLAMTRIEFRDYAYAGMAIRLVMPPRISSVRVGFDEILDRVYRPNEKGESTRIWLADFVDYSQIDQRSYQGSCLNLQFGNQVLTLICISSDPIPEIISFTAEPAIVTVGETTTLSWVTQNAEAGGVVIEPEIGSVGSSGSITVPAETTTYSLRLAVAGMDDVTQAVTVTVFSRSQPEVRVRRTDGGWRHGRGFSRRELRAVDLNDADAKRRSIPVDKRRRSTHQANIDELRRSSDA